MIIRVAISSLLLCMLFNCIHSQDWGHHEELDDEGRFHLYWNLPADERGDSEINFRLEIMTKGCFSFGFSPDGNFPLSDIVIGWIKDGEVYFQDRHVDASGMWIEDPQQDYELLNAFENDTFTVFEFSRRLDTCDENDMAIDESTMRVIFTYCEEDPDASILDGPIDPKIDASGKKSIVLLNYNSIVNLDLSSLLQWDLKAPEIDISGKQAYIFCKIVKSPQVDEKHHIVLVEPQIQEGHEEFVYHLGLYECVGGTPEEYDDLLDDRGYECYTPDFPPPMFKCQGLLAAWGAGGGNMPLSDRAGLPIHPAPGRYYMFEVNYENLEKKTGIVDSSGFRFYYTPELREYDAGNYVLCASILPRTFIPPGQDEFVVAGHTNPECVSSGFPEDGAKSFAVFVHARGLGRTIKIRHFRGNEELVPLVNDQNYDAYYQPFRYSPEEVVLLPNDQLTIECTFNSTERKDATLSGMTVVDEICASVIMYYPFVEGKYYSWSAASFDSINGILNTDIKNEEDAARILKSYDWSTVNIDEVQNVTRYSEHQSQCYFGPFREDIDHTLVSYPSDLQPYVRQPTCSKK